MKRELVSPLCEKLRVTSTTFQGKKTPNSKLTGIKSLSSQIYTYIKLIPYLLSLVLDVWLVSILCCLGAEPVI